MFTIITTLFLAVENAAPPTNNFLLYILGAVASGGIATGVVAYIRLKKQGAAEKEEIISRAAEQAVRAMEQSLNRLEAELNEARKRRAELLSQVSTAVSARHALEDRVNELTLRISSLEASIIGFKSKESFIKTVATTYDGIFLVVISTGEIIYANPAAHLLLGYQHRSLVGENIEIFIPEEVRDNYHRARIEYSANPVNLYLNDKIKNLIGINKDGKKLPVFVKLTPLDNDLVIVTAREH